MWLKQEGELQHKSVRKTDEDFTPCVKLTEKDHNPDMNLKSL